MKRWTSISSNNEDKRWAYLSARLNAVGVANEYVPWGERALDDLTALAEFDHVRLSTRIGPQIVKNLKVQSSWTTLLGVIDGMVKGPNGWWPLCAIYESFGQLLIGLGQDLDMRGNVFVAGAGGAARSAIAAFFKAGFTKFLLTNFDQAEAEQTMKDVKQKFFGLSIEWVPVERIVLLPGDSSVLVNCTPTLEGNALLVELSYLNFLKRPGFLFDVNRTAKESILVQEARDAGVRLITGSDIATRSDILWAKWAFNADLSLEDYAKDFGSVL